MSLTVTVVPGYLPADGEKITPAILRSIATPTVNISGAVGTALLPDNSVTTAKLVDGVLSADTTGRAKMADSFITLAKVNTGIFTADASGRAPFATGWLNLSLVASGIFAATTAGRAPFASGVITAALCQPDAYGYATGGGTASAYTATFSPALSAYTSPTITAYWDGLEVWFKASATNADSVTLNVDTLGAKGIYRPNGTACKAGDILINTTVGVRYNTSLNSGAGGWQLITPLAISTTFANYFRSGSGSATNATATVISFSTSVPDTSYIVLISVTADAGNSIVPKITSKTTSGFTITFTGASSSHSFDYVVLPMV